MINRKFFIAIIFIALSGYQQPLGAMAGLIAHPERNDQIINLRNQINRERTFISRACWSASAALAAAAGSFTGWFLKKHGSQLPRFLQSYRPFARTCIGATGATLLTLSASWLTKHWGFYHFFTHRGHINNLKNLYHNIKREDRAERNQFINMARGNLNTFEAINNNIQRLERELQNIGPDHQREINRRRQDLDRARQELQQMQQTINLLRQEAQPQPQPQPQQAQRVPEFLYQQIQPDVQLQPLSKDQLEEQFIRETSEAANMKNIRPHWVRICQLVMELANKLCAADAQHPQDVSEACKHNLLIFLLFALENHCVDLCRNLARCGLAFHMLPAINQQIVDLHTLFQRLDNELIRQFIQECPVCYENINDQHRGQVLPCGHVICQPCLAGLQNHAQKFRNEKLKLQQANQLPENYAIPSGRPACPTCQAEF